MTDTDTLVIAVTALVAFFSGAFSIFTDNLKQAGALIGRAITTETDPKNGARISLLSVARPSLKFHHGLMITVLIQVPKTILIAGSLFSYFYFYRIGGLVFLVIYLAGIFLNKVTSNEFRHYLASYINWLTRIAARYQTGDDDLKLRSLSALLVNLNKMYAIYKDSDVGVPGKEAIASAPLGDIWYLKKSNPFHFSDEREKIIAANKAKAKSI